MINLHSYLATVEKNIENWEKEIYRFRVIAEEADPNPQIEHYQVIEDIVAKEKAIKEKFAKLKEQGEPGWNETAMEEFDELQKSLEKAIESARIAR